MWPSDVLPEFEAAFKELGQLVVKVRFQVWGCKYKGCSTRGGLV